MRFAYDTNVWRYLDADAEFARAVNAMRLDPVTLLAVVAAELIRGATSRTAVQRAETVLERWGHTLEAPSKEDWLTGARALHRVGRRFHYDPAGITRLQNDALIAVQCARRGWTVVTTNRVDFERITEALGSKAPGVKYLIAPG